jgi:predicted Ser/Thr protein kinase/endonuclease/exonuclease/phosphatase family metal-dependent hydrolase
VSTSSQRRLHEKPEAIGPYRPVRLLGSGAMAAVWLCEDAGSKRVAVKWLERVTPRIRKRFQRECEALARIDDPRVIAVLEQGEADGRPYLVMEYIRGVDLRVYTAKLRLRPAAERFAEVRRIGEALCCALEAVHAAGLIHRDVKPSNVLLDTRGRVKLADFGVVKDLEDTDYTRAGKLVGTVGYAAPEQILGQEVDPRVDLYGLGCTLYYLLTGQRPYPSKAREEVVAGHLRGPIPRPSRIDPEVPAALDAVIARLLAKAPADRYPDARAARKALVATGGGEEVLPLAGRRRYVDRARQALARLEAGTPELIHLQGPKGSGRAWLMDIIEDLGRRGGLPLLIAREEAELAEGMARLGAGEVLGVVTTRSLPLPPAGVAVDEIHLEPLGMGDVRRTVVSVAPETENPSVIAEELHRATGGHPAWLLPLLSSCRSGDRLTPPDPLPAPPALLEAVAALSPDEVEVLGALAVRDQAMSLAEIEAAAQVPAEGPLERLVAEGLALHHAGRWWLMGGLVRDAGMSALPDPEATRRRARARVEASEDGEEVDLRALSLKGDLTTARQEAEAAALLARARGDRAAEARALLALGAVLLDAGDYGPADRRLADAVALARAVGLHEVRRAAHVLRAQATLEARPGHPGAASAALDRLSRALTRVSGPDPQGYRALAMATRARANAALGDRYSWEQSAARADAARAEADPLVQLLAELELARAALLVGDRAQALARADRCGAEAAARDLELLAWQAARVRATATGHPLPPPTFAATLDPVEAARLDARPVW